MRRLFQDTLVSMQIHKLREGIRNTIARGPFPPLDDAWLAAALMPTPTRQPRYSARLGFAFLLSAAGLGLCLWYGQAWRQLPHYTARDIDESARLNLAADLARSRPPTPLTAAQHAQRLPLEREEVVEDIDQHRQVVRAGFIAGLTLLAFAALQFLANRLSQRSA